MKEKNYIPELDFLRGISIIGVLLIHGMNNITWVARNDQFSVNYAMFWNQFSRFCVPIFIFVSGLLLVYHYQHSFNYWVFLKKRLVHLLPPYLFWTALSIIISLDKWGPITVERIWRTVVFGQGYYYHLYFIPLIFQFYLLAPLFLYGFKQKHLKTFVLSCVLFNMIYLVAYQLVYLNILPIDEKIASFWHRNIQPNFLAWIGYFALGGLVGSNLEKWRLIVRQVSWTLATGLFICSLILLLIDYRYSVIVTGDLFSPGENFMRPMVFIYTLTSLLLLWKIAQTIKGSSVWYTIGTYSLGIYFVHLMVQNILVNYSRKVVFFSGWWQSSFAIIVILLISISLSWIFGQLPLGQLLVGNIMKQKR